MIRPSALVSGLADHDRVTGEALRARFMGAIGMTIAAAIRREQRPRVGILVVSSPDAGTADLVLGQVAQRLAGQNQLLQLLFHVIFSLGGPGLARFTMETSGARENPVDEQEDPEIVEPVYCEKWR